jgi:hypothetical protein
LIPHRLSFNYKNNILQDKKPKGLYNNLINTISVYSKVWNNNETDSHNMTIDFRIPMPRGRGPGQSPRLLEYFNKEKRGSWRSDICRVADLYLKGGYYMDNDMRAVEAIVFPDNIFFSTRKQRAKLFQSLGQHAWESIFARPWTSCSVSTTNTQ